MMSRSHPDDKYNCRSDRVWCSCLCHMRDSDLPGLEDRALCRIEADIAAGIDVGQVRASGHKSGLVRAGGYLRSRKPLNQDLPRYFTRPAKPYINKLPNELLCEIISMCGDPNATFDYPRDSRMHSNDSTPRHTFSWAAMVTGYVCSRWLRVTRGSPTLWTLVDLMFLQRRHVVVMRCCLRYSAGLPLTLRLVETSTAGTTIHVTRRIMNAVADNAGRWKEISLFLDSALGVLDAMTALPANSFASLERAKLYFRECGHRPHRLDNRLWKLIYGSPSLRRLEWWSDPFDLLSASSAPLGQLTHVGVKHLQPKHLIPLLQLCPQLEIFQATIEPAIEDLRIPASELLPSGTAPITLKNLRVLMLNGLEDYSRLYACLNVPALRRLDLHGSGVQAGAMKDMLRRSKAKLRMLTLFWTVVGWMDDIKDLLRSTEMQSLAILRYDPCTGVRQTRMSETTNLHPFVPSHVEVFTSHFKVAEDAYKETN